MIKLVAVLAANAVALSLSCVACAADEKTQNQPGAPTMQDEGSPPPELSKQSKSILQPSRSAKACKTQRSRSASNRRSKSTTACDHSFPQMRP